MEFLNKIKEALKPKSHKGNLGAMAFAFVGLILAGFFLMVYLYTNTTLATSLNNTNVTTVSNNITLSAVNFTGQLGTVGTIAGVMLLIGLIGGGVLYGAKKIGGGEGTGL